MFARSADELAGRMVLSEVEGPGNSVPWQGVQGDGVPPALGARSGRRHRSQRPKQRFGVLWAFATLHKVIKTQNAKFVRIF